MYVAPVDRSLGEDEWRPFVHAQGFGHLAACGVGRAVPVVVPTQFVLEQTEVLLHLVGVNPIFDAIREQPEALLSVAGDWAYVPSDWKTVEGEDPLLGIPTTYYGAVQINGTAQIIEDPDEVAAILRVQLGAFQPFTDVADPAQAHRARLGQIRGLKISIDDVVAKFKYGGNVDAAHRQTVIDHLRQRSLPGDEAAAAHTLRRLGV